MITFWVLWMLWIFGMIAAWGVREDKKRRFYREIRRLTLSFEKLGKQFGLFGWQIDVLKSLLSSKTPTPYIYSPRYKSAGHVQFTRADGTIFDPSVKEKYNEADPRLYYSYRDRSTRLGNSSIRDDG